MVSSSYSTSGTRRVALVTNPVISYEGGKDLEVLMISGTYPWSNETGCHFIDNMSIRRHINQLKVHLFVKETVNCLDKCFSIR
jgi:hypothetical protein